MQVLASRTGAVLSTLTLTQPPTKAAAQRSMLARRAAAKLRLQSVSNGMQDTLAADVDGLPDMAGLDKLLQEDLPAAAAAAPPAVMAKLAGPGSMLANTMAGIVEGDAPTPVSAGADPQSNSLFTGAVAQRCCRLPLAGTDWRAPPALLVLSLPPHRRRPGWRRCS
jgi:hypothetical protein